VKRLLPAVLMLLAATVSSTTSSWARTTPQSAQRFPRESVFRLSVDGPVARSDTFWVAYGPLDGTWGVIRLDTIGPRQYEARAMLPRGRTVFSFIEGRGVMHTRLGSVPGNPVSTIRQMGPTSASGVAFPLVVWHEPIG
jgi:hypothetical protein